MSVFPRHDTHHLKHTPDLISMQQYANGLDLLVSVSFISPGFFLFLSLSKPCCRSLHPSLLFFLSWQRLHTHTQINSVNSSTVWVPQPSMCSSICVLLQMCAPYWSPLSEGTRPFNVHSFSGGTCSTATSAIPFLIFQTWQEREK